MNAVVLALAAAVATIVGPDCARAMSVGVYGSLGAGSAEWRDSSYGGYEDWWDTRHGGAGLVLDSAAPLSAIGYRLSIGWERITHERRFTLSGLELEGVVVDQDLMIPIIAGPGPMRVWAGPELRIGYFEGSIDGVDGDEDFLALGLGPVVGLDFDVSPAMAVSWKLGYLFSGYSGRGRSSSAEDSTLGENHAFVSLAILFSPWGDYRRQAPAPFPPPGPPPGYSPRRW